MDSKAKDSTAVEISSNGNYVNDGSEIQELQQPEATQELQGQKIIEIKKRTSYKWWLQLIVYSFLVIAGQSVGTLVGRLYYDNGGESEWLSTLVQVVGFPVLLPLLFFTKLKSGSDPNTQFAKILFFFYLPMGIFLAADCIMYAIGLQYLPVTTYSLICASQLGFNALFSFFINKQKFTLYILISLVLLTISSVVSVFETQPGDSNKASKRKYVIGLICTVAASAGSAVMLSVTQLVFQRIIKHQTVRTVVDMMIYMNLVATCVIVVGLFQSGDGRKLRAEMEGYRTGKVSYVMNVFWSAISWQAFGVGGFGLIYHVSSLFSNAIGVVGLAIAPVMAVMFLHDELTRLKGVSLFLGMWGFVSYIYQQYRDHLDIEREERDCDV